MKYLEVGTGNRFCELVKQRLLDLCKFGWIHDFKNVFYFIQKHDFLCAVHLRPISKQTEDNLNESAMIT